MVSIAYQKIRATVAAQRPLNVCANLRGTNTATALKGSQETVAIRDQHTDTR